MIQPFLSLLNKQHIVLASSSPRRKEILEKIGLKVQVIPSTFNENLNIHNFACPSDYVIETAKRKALDVANQLKVKKTIPDLIISADTIVVLEKEIIGKPKDESDAITILNKLNGRRHAVLTGLTIMFWSQKTNKTDFDIKTFCEETEVSFAQMSLDVIKAYVATQEPLGKAGAYAVQGIGGSLIECINGDYYNVVGFPLNKFCKEIQKLCLNN